MTISRGFVSLRTYALVFAVALSPAVLETVTCERGDTYLLVLELEADGVNHIEGFDPNIRSYDVSPEGPTAVLRTETRDPTSEVTYQWMDGATTIESGMVGVGGGEVTLSVPAGQATLRVSVRARESGGLDYYAIGSCRCATAFYDRMDRARMSPFPDDYWVFPDPSLPSGNRVVLTVPQSETDVSLLYASLMRETSELDGFSPIGGIVIELSEEPDPSSLPVTPGASVAPSASLRLYDVAPTSAAFGAQIPFQLTPVSRALPGQPINHSLVLYPSIPLTPTGRYAVVLTKAAKGTDSRPFCPSAFMSAVLAAPMSDEPPEITRVRGLLDTEVLDVVTNPDIVSSAIVEDEIALAFRFSVRSTADIPQTPLSMKEQILAGAAPSFQIQFVEPGYGSVAAIVRGTWQAPNWRENQYFIARDSNGDPRITGSLTVPFVLALPYQAESGPVPVVMFQHGSPGSAEQVAWEANLTLANEGFAAIGFTDTLNRELGQDLDYQNSVLFQTLLAEWRFPHFAMQTYADQMAFLRVIEQLGALDVVPFPGGDGVPDLDLDAPLGYVGLSMGSIHGSAFLTYAPEIKAAAIAAGAQRQGEQYFGGGSFIDNFPPDLGALLPNAKPSDYWVGLSIFQMVFDHQDPHNHAAFLYRNRFEVAGTTQKPSVLLQEGVRDLRVPNNLTRSLAWTFGPIPHLEPIWEDTLILDAITSPVRGNIDGDTTAAFYQFVPAGIPGIPETPGCAPYIDGHACAQAAPEAQRQRATFLQSAVADSVPTITDPLQYIP